MKRIFMLLLALLCIAALMSCGAEQTPLAEETEAPAEPQPAPEPEQAEMQEELPITIAGVAEYAWLSVGNHIAVYEKCTVQGGVPEDLVGETYQNRNSNFGTTFAWYDGEELVEASANVHLLNGHADLQSIISVSENGNRTLWKFSEYITWASDELFALFPDAVIEEDYGYQLVLMEIYGLRASDAIASVTVYPSSRSYTPEGDAMRERIGVLELTDRDDIRTVRDILVSMRRLTDDTIVLPLQEIAVKNGVLDDSVGMEGMLRELTITLQNGLVIDNLEYSAVEGHFYEPGSIYYAPVGEEDAAVLNVLLGIEAEQEAYSPGNAEELITEEAVHAYVESYMQRNFRELPLYDILTWERTLFRDAVFERINERIVRYPAEANNYILNTTMSDDVFYYLHGPSDEYEASKQLIRMMMEDLKDADPARCLFTLLDYEIPDQTLYGFSDLIAFHSDVCWEKVSGMKVADACIAIEEYLKSLDAGMGYMALGSNMWILDPTVLIQYEGVANGYTQEELEALGVAQGGFVPEGTKDSTAMDRYLLIHNNKGVWRMQRVDGLIAMMNPETELSAPEETSEIVLEVPTLSVEQPEVQQPEVQQPETQLPPEPATPEPPAEEGSISVDFVGLEPVPDGTSPEGTHSPGEDPTLTDEEGQALANLLASLSYNGYPCDGITDYVVTVGGRRYAICSGCRGVVYGGMQASLTDAQLAQILSWLN